MIRIFLLIFLIFTGCSSSSTSTLVFTVDASDVGKRVFSLGGVNAGPIIKGTPERDVTDQYREMKISGVRTHDFYGYLDLLNIFFNGWLADPDNPGNYDFSEADRIIESIENVPSEVMFRLGESWYNDDPHNEIPADFDTVALVCEQIVLHFGGDECNPYQCRIRLWEFWNEPNHTMFWDLKQDPNLQQFFDLYALVARGLKERFPNILVGGPGMAGGPDQEIEDFAHDFVQAVLDREAPLDFYSWHSYNRDHDGPYVFARQAQKVRSVLNDLGFGKTLNVLSEWNVANINVEDPEWRAMLYNMDGAAFTVSALIYMHLHSDLRYAYRYRGDIHSGDEGFGLINVDGSIKKPGYGLKAYESLFPQKDQREMSLLATGGGDLENRAIMATMDEGGVVINVLISFWRSGDQTFKLVFNYIPEGWGEPTLEHYVVSEGRDYELVEKRILSDLSTNDPSYEYSTGKMLLSDSSIHLIRIYDATKFPVLKPADVQPVGSL